MRTPTSKVNIPSPKRNAKSIMAIALTICISCGGFVTVQHAYSETPIKVIAQPPFTGSDGKLNVVGIVKNRGNMPVEVNLGLNIAARDSGLVTTIKEPTYGRVIYPSNVSPFKFVVEPSWSLSGGPFILNSKEVSTPYYKVLSLSYSNMPVGNDKALIGTAKNVSPVDLHNVTILASVHKTNGTQIDSVKSQLFPVIRTSQTVAFAALPDPAIKSNIAYFSCADIDVGNNSALNTLGIGNGQFIAYQMNGVVQISDFRYDNTTDSLVFGIKHYNPAGGPFSLKLPEMSKNRPVSVILDGKLYTEASVKMDGKTVRVDFFVPPDNHQVQIKGIRNTA
ncbi:MAG: hypothetical protein M3Y53_04330 [Thermoproteota archaeon]|nr:hypothetical protein [Thermoproteota archaeon]